MTPKRKQAIVVGETGLCLKCAELLISSGWKIISIASNDNVICDWATNNSIPILSPSQLDTLQVEEDFYLFSIINPYLFSILSHKKLLLALNCHNGPLLWAYVNNFNYATTNDGRRHRIT